jgi:peptidoglycan/LPS O-acetylase OafA/YrhL
VSGIDYGRDVSERRSSEWPVLAGVRFLMALAVVNYHFFITGADHGVPYLETLGSIGCICGFLVISGYSIAHSISTQPKGFLVRRAWRILPIYYAVMAFALVPYLFTRAHQPFRFDVGVNTRPEIIGSLFLLQTFVTTKVPVFGPSWTLAIEWWFYALAPVFLRLKNWTLVLVIYVSIMMQRELLDMGYYPLHEFRWGIPAGMLLWAWLSGFLFYRAKGWSAVLMVVVGTWTVAAYHEGDTQLPYVIASFAVLQAKSFPPIPAWAGRFLNYLGDLSYPLYLVHVPLMLWLGRWVHWQSPYAFLAASLAASMVLYHGIDKPLRARFSSRGAPRIKAPTGLPTA